MMNNQKKMVMIKKKKKNDDGEEERRRRTATMVPNNGRISKREKEKNKGEQLIPYDPKLEKFIRKKMNDQERKAQRLRQIVKARARGNSNNVNNNNVGNELGDDEDGCVAVNRHPVSRAKGKHRQVDPIDFDFDEDEADMDEVGATRLLFSHP
uniref:Uncharacterized protein n=1 Tax=Solanum tuberosum TaxID=4113 RepID=M0ZKR4_SOLTU